MENELVQVILRKKCSIESNTAQTLFVDHSLAGNNRQSHGPWPMAMQAENGDNNMKANGFESRTGFENEDNNPQHQAHRSLTVIRNPQVWP